MGRLVGGGSARLYSPESQKDFRAVKLLLLIALLIAQRETYVDLASARPVACQGVDKTRQSTTYLESSGLIICCDSCKLINDLDPSNVLARTNRHRHVGQNWRVSREVECEAN